MLNEPKDALVERRKSGEMIGREDLALKDAEPQLDLIEPRGVLGQPGDLYREGPVVLTLLLGEPALQPFRCMGRAMVQNQAHLAHLAPLRLRHHGAQQECLKVHEALACLALAIDQAVGHAQRGKQLSRTLAIVASGDMLGLTGLHRPGSVQTLARLDRGLLIEAHHPDAGAQPLRRMLVEPEHGPGALQKLRVLRALPQVIGPWLEPFGVQVSAIP